MYCRASLLPAPQRSEAGSGANLIKWLFSRIDPRGVERHRRAAHSSEKAGANESNAPPKKNKKSLAMLKTTDKTMPPEELAQ
ncbi:MAG: hypothetical protein DME77_04085 [Verrucomicrobia bacterium]|nr:MAG: hypothetical protein DME77_04085 [Verrucomicrobiota bacterium]